MILETYYTRSLSGAHQWLQDFIRGLAFWHLAGYGPAVYTLYIYSMH